CRVSTEPRWVLTEYRPVGQDLLDVGPHPRARLADGRSPGAVEDAGNLRRPLAQRGEPENLLDRRGRPVPQDVPAALQRNPGGMALSARLLLLPGDARPPLPPRRRPPLV